MPSMCLDQLQGIIPMLTRLADGNSNGEKFGAEDVTTVGVTQIQSNGKWWWHLWKVGPQTRNSSLHCVPATAHGFHC